MKLRPFEIVLIAVFVGLAVLSLIFVSTIRGGSSSDEVVIGPVSIWGTLDGAKMAQLLNEIGTQDDQYADVTYRQVDQERFASSLTNALADGNGPDLILISHEQLTEMRKRISPVSYESFPLRDVRSLYIDGAEVFALSDGLYAYPMAVDPLMLYWNRDILATQNLLTAPATWESLVSAYVPNLTQRDFDRTVGLSAVALGEYANIENAFGIISTLLLQSGSRMVDEQGGTYTIKLNESATGGQSLVTVTDFYTRFSRPNNTLYTWNRSFNNDRARFLSEDLALYFGMGSEGKQIEKLNPNLNFDIAEVPQGASATIRRTYGEFYGLALVRGSDNVPGAAAVLGVLTRPDFATRIAADNNLVPVTRNEVAAGSNDTYGRLTYRSAGISYGWLNPERAAVDGVFTSLMRDVTEGRFDEGRATADALGRLQLEYN